MPYVSTRQQLKVSGSLCTLLSAGLFYLLISFMFDYRLRIHALCQYILYGVFTQRTISTTTTIHDFAVHLLCTGDRNGVVTAAVVIPELTTSCFISRGKLDAIA